MTNPHPEVFLHMISVSQWQEAAEEAVQLAAWCFLLQNDSQSLNGSDFAGKLDRQRSLVILFEEIYLTSSE